METQWLKNIAKSPLFTGIALDLLPQTIDCLKLHLSPYAKNTPIVLGGSSFTGIGIILEGCAAVVKENAAGNRMIMAILEPGDIFGEMAAFSETRQWPATVLAQEPCTVLFINADKIAAQCQSACIAHQTLTRNMFKLLSQKALLLNRKLEYISMRSLRTKIASFLLETHQKTGSLTFTLPIKRNEWADFLNVSRPSLSRELCRMRDEGMIEFHRESIRICNLKRLRLESEEKIFI